jgi:hypothetical protein
MVDLITGKMMAEGMTTHGGVDAGAERSPMHLDDLEDRLGTRLDPIRAALAGDPDLAVVLAHDLVDGDDFVLVATDHGVHVRRLWPDAPRPLLPTTYPEIAPWASVSVSPVWSEGWHVHGVGQTSLATHGFELRIGATGFLVAANGTTGRWAVDGFHDEVVRRAQTS